MQALKKDFAQQKFMSLYRTRRERVDYKLMLKIVYIAKVYKYFLYYYLKKKLIFEYKCYLFFQHALLKWLMNILIGLFQKEAEDLIIVECDDKNKLNFIKKKKKSLLSYF